MTDQEFKHQNDYAQTALSYHYDDLHRIEWFKKDGILERQYFYDDNGNFEQFDGVDFVYAYNNNQLTYDGSRQFDFDEVGRVKAINSTSLTYDIFNNMRSYGNDRYEYDDQNLRIFKKEGNEYKYYINDGLNTLAEYIPYDKLQAEYVYGVSGMVAKIDPVKGYLWFYKDHLGSTRELGTSDMRRDYYPFGEEFVVAGDAGTNYKFTGKELDKETGLYYFGARYYDPGIGRWLVPDPKSDNHPQWSPYVYCFNNPLQLVDPDGEEPNKSQSTNPRQFIDFLINNYQNNARETLAYLGNYKTLGGSDPSHKRYLYTRKGGWIDLVHFFGVAAEIDKLSKIEKIGAYTAGGFALWQETKKTEKDQLNKGSIGSVWSYEDAPSNYLGYIFWKFYYNPKGDLIKQIIELLKKYDATDSEDAPNWEGMWEFEHTFERQFPQNKSFNPMFTTDDDNDDDWWEGWGAENQGPPR